LLPFSTLSLKKNRKLTEISLSFSWYFFFHSSQKHLNELISARYPPFLNRTNILDNNQSSFKSGHSTETALLSVIEALRLARAASKSSVLILLDLSAAFDTVNHQILLSILKMKGISGNWTPMVQVLTLS